MTAEYQSERRFPLKHGRASVSEASGFPLPILVALIMALFVTPARAQEQADVDATSAGPPRTIEEIMVTARKRSESLQRTPIAISAFSANALEERNLTNLVEIGNYVPNVVMSTGPGGSGAGNNAQVYIRGIGQTDFLFTTDPGVGIYVDGVYHPRTLGGVMDLLDLERVEVLRGPQGTLFGKNTIGGAVSLTSAKPDEEFGGFAEVTTGRYSRLDVRGSFNVPIVEDRLFMKVSFSSKNRDGYGKRLDFFTGDVTGETGDENVTASRVAFRWLASDDIEVNLTGDYTRERESSLPTTLVLLDQTQGLTPLWNALVGVPSGLPISDVFITGDPYTSFGTGPNENTLDAWGLALTVDWDLGSISLKSITAYRQMDATFGRDGDGSPISWVHTDQIQDQDQFSQEFRISGSHIDDRLKWVAGVFYFDEFGRDHNDVRLASGLFDALEALPGPIIQLSPLPCPAICAGGMGNPINIGFDIDLDVLNEIDIESIAAFSQGTFAVTEKLSISAGIRYTHEKKDYTLEHGRVNAMVFTIPLTTIGDSWNSFTPMGSIEYQWTEDMLTYFSVSRGFKSGGFNGRPILESAVESFDPEKVTAFEVGAKSEWFERRLRLNVAAFYNDYTDIQLGFNTTDSTGNLVLIVENAGKAEVKGFEVEIQARPVPGLDITGSVGYTDFKFKSLNPGATITLDTQQPKSPKWNASGSIQYTFELEESGFLTIRGDWSYVGKNFADVVNTEVIAQRGHSLFSARLVYEPPSEQWEVAVFGTNLSNERYIENGIAAPAFGHAEGFFAPPRQWGVRLKARF